MAGSAPQPAARVRQSVAAHDQRHASATRPRAHAPTYRRPALLSIRTPTPYTGELLSVFGSSKHTLSTILHSFLHHLQKVQKLAIVDFFVTFFTVVCGVQRCRLEYMCYMASGF